MKLFGNKHGGARAAGRSSNSARQKRNHRLSGVQRGLILLAASVLVLTGTIWGVYRSVVRPVEIKQPEPKPPVQTEEREEEEEVFVPPTVVQIQTKVDEETGEEVEVEVEVPATQKEGFYNILIAGTDDDGTRTDTIMIGRLNTKDHTVALLSVPRDTLINSKSLRINTVYGANGKGKQGMEALKSALASLLGFEVNGYVLVNLNAFVELVDLVGGVDFEVPQRMYYSDPTQDLYIDLQAGLQHLDGKQAMGVVRFRKGYASQDIMRTQVQQNFLKALADKILSVATLTKLGGMAKIFNEHVTTDLTVGNMVYFGQELMKCDFDSMFTYTLEGEGVMLNGASVWAVYLHKTLDVVNQYFNPYDAEITAANVTIRTPESVRAEQTPETPEPETPSEPQEPEVPEAPPEEIPQEPLPGDPWEEGPADPWEQGTSNPWDDPVGMGDSGTVEDPWVA